MRHVRHRHVSKVQLTRVWHTMLEDFVIKYWWGAMGMLITALPVFFEVGLASQRGENIGGRTQGPSQNLFFDPARLGQRQRLTFLDRGILPRQAWSRTESSCRARPTRSAASCTRTRKSPSWPATQRAYVLLA